MSKNIPRDLKIVAALFLLMGISSLINIFVRLANGSLHLDFGVFGIPAYFGLRRFSSGWRTYALVCVWMGLICSPILFIGGFTLNAPGKFEFFGITLAKVSPIWLSIMCIPLFGLSLWQYRVLTRREISNLFQK